MWLTRSEAKQTKMSEFRAEKGLLQGHGRRGVGDSGEGWVTCDHLNPLNPQLFEGVSAKYFKGKVKERHGSLLQTLGVSILRSCSCPWSSVQGGPVNFQLDKFFSVLQLFNLYMNAKVTLKGQSLENGLSCTFQAIGNILNIKQEQ